MDMSRFIKDKKNKVLEIPKLTDIAKTEIYYFDENGKSCDKKEAVKFIAKSYDNYGNFINETWGHCVTKEEKGKSK